MKRQRFLPAFFVTSIVYLKAAICPWSLRWSQKEEGGDFCWSLRCSQKEKGAVLRVVLFLPLFLKWRQFVPAFFVAPIVNEKVAICPKRKKAPMFCWSLLPLFMKRQGFSHWSQHCSQKEEGGNLSQLSPLLLLFMKRRHWLRKGGDFSLLSPLLHLIMKRVNFRRLLHCSL